MGLQPFEGTPVVSSGFILRAASGGLNAALVVENLELHKDDEITIALRCKVHGVNFPPVRDTDGVQRVHVLDIMPGGVARIDLDAVAEAMEAQRLKAEQAVGVNRLPNGEGEPGDAYVDPDEADDPGDTPPE